MSPTHRRIELLAAAFLVALGAVLLHLWFVMVENHETWLVRSHQNRWAFRDVPTVRGALRDRKDRLLAWDEPTIDLSCLYARFRRRHPVGAAVHGATVWLQRQPGGAGVRFGYLDAALGPESALQALLDVPAAALRRGVLPKVERDELLACTTSVLATTAGRERKDVARALLQAARAPGAVAVGDALPGVARPALVEEFARAVGRLRALDRAIRELHAPAAAADLPGDQPGEAAVDLPERGLLSRLERFRRESLARTRVVLTEEDGSAREGSLLEDVLRPVATDLPFQVAAALRTGSTAEPGLELQPALRRAHAPEAACLQTLLGGVADVDKTSPPESWLRERVDEALETDELEDLVPTEAVPSAEYVERLREEARARYGSALLLRQRRGTGGLEGRLDRVLSGQPGLRFVERDAHKKEQLLWSSLRVQPGSDVVLTLDRDLQRLVGEAAVAARSRWLPDHPDPERLDVAIAVIDAHTGDVLAIGGAPDRLGDVPRVPGLEWRSAGDIGSVVKPFVLLEQLAATAAGRPHQDLETLAPCSGHHVYAGVRLTCDDSHGARGRDPVQALAQSCNSFFYQLGEGLGEDGIARALARFGLAPPTADGTGTASWQPRPAELRVAAPRRSSMPLLPRRAIGYGVESSPLHVARAYAALATGRLPTLGLVRGAARPAVALPVAPDDLELVREGLRTCVDSGTAKHVPVLQALGVSGKTGTAEVGAHHENNAVFAGWLPFTATNGVQLCFCGIVWFAPNKVHGGKAAGELIGDLLERIRRDPGAADYLVPEGGR